MLFSRFLIGLGNIGIVFLLGSLVFAHGDSFVIPPDLYGPAVVLSVIFLLLGALMYHTAWKNTPAEEHIHQRTPESEPAKAEAEERENQGAVSTSYLPQPEPAI